jgi:hypothetical protein
VLERVVFPELMADRTCKAVLFVGCDWYTRWYPTLFDWCSDVVFATVERDPAKARFGSRRHHTIGSLDELEWASASCDLVILNGVFGFGIDSPADKARALETAHRLLTPGGRLLIGYNDADEVLDGEIVRDRCRYDARAVDPARFAPCRIPGLPCADYLTRTPNRHRYVCLAKRVEPPAPAEDIGIRKRAQGSRA